MKKALITKLKRSFDKDVRNLSWVFGCQEVEPDESVSIRESLVLPVYAAQLKGRLK